MKTIRKLIAPIKNTDFERSKLTISGPTAAKNVGGHAKMKYKIIIILLLISFQSFGTAQIPDRLIYGDDTLSLFFCPLELYPDKELITPQGLFDSKGCFYTACWRNYVATWSIERNNLYLLEIRNACYPTNMQDVEGSFKSGVDSIGQEFADLKSLFPERYDNGRVKADWVSGELIVPKGELIYYFNEGFQSIYEVELMLTVGQGILVSKQILDNLKTKKSKYAQDSKLLHKFIGRHMDEENLPESDSVTRKVFVQILSTDDEGKIDSVKVVHGINKLYDNEAARLIKKIPEWDVIYRHGEK
ncbi:MAG: hypothetical protein WBA23_11535, partial [Tunicatimonas sp.]|uniref:hypothetical protein n=1 Tax=Tunicatimonas sp. TaxID=1940096 RepID=UPI003C78C47C